MSHEQIDTRKWYNRFDRQRPKYSGRRIILGRDANHDLVLHDDAAAQQGARPISDKLKQRFLREVQQRARHWHNLGADHDIFAQGAVVQVIFRGDSTTILQLRQIPGVLSWKQLRRQHVGAVEKITYPFARLRGMNAPQPRRVISRLGGDQHQSMQTHLTAS